MPSVATPSSDRSALLRIQLTYLWRHGRLAQLREPTLFTELVQLRKLNDRDPRLPIMADKVGMKAIVAERLGREWVVPMLWSGPRLAPQSCWKTPIVIKSRHGCNQTLVMHDAERHWPAARTRTATWMKRTYGTWLDEWLYAHIPRGLLIEPFIGTGRQLPVDYKIYVFHGQATHVQVHLERATNHRWVLHDTQWRALSAKAEPVPRPSALPAMLAAAEELARDFTFARVDFYQPHDRPLFGEMTFYPGSGLDPFCHPELDRDLGKLWLGTDQAHAGRRTGDTIAA